MIQASRLNGWLTTKTLLALLLTLSLSYSPASGEPRLLFVADQANDVLQAAQATFDSRVVLFDQATQAIDEAESDDVLLVLADRFPTHSTAIQKDQLRALQQKQVRAYLECPEWLGPATPSPQVERVVVVDNSLNSRLPKMSVLQANGLHYIKPPADGWPDLGQPALVAARVAGFDTAIYGLPDNYVPLLLIDDGGTTLIATTNLSQYRRGRYAPYGSWQAVWEGVFQKLLQSSNPVELKFAPPVVTTAHERDSDLPADSQRQAIDQGIAWFAKSNMVIHPEWQDLVLGTEGRVRPLPADLPMGDGSLGSMEAVLSIIESSGHQVISSVQRSDCISETAMAFAICGKLHDDRNQWTTGKNLLDYLLLESPACKNERGDPEHGAYGLIAWGITNPAWYVANYGDDNARVLLAVVATAGLLEEDRWDETVARAIVANLRTTGKLGFRGSRIDLGPLGTNGWKHYFERSPVEYAPHFECYLWACYLWAYSQTGDPLLLDRARTGLEMTMEQYPNGLHWTNGLAQERARLLLPLAWLVRVDDNPRNRAMLNQAVEGLLSIQDECGAIREELGPPNKGKYPPPGSNEAYGVTEASLLARNGDPVADMLYTNNFALLGLHEAAAVANDARVTQAADRLAEFMIRIQAKSPLVPEVDGGWMRAFDFHRWEAWGSNADHGWGAWSIESGWTQAWITSMLAMREMETSLWDVMAMADISQEYPAIREAMLPQAYVDQVEAKDP